MHLEKTIYIAIYFDDTITTGGYPEVGTPVPDALRVIKKLHNVPGVKLILLTMRSGPTLEMAVNYCKENGVEFWAHNDNPEQEKWTSSRKVYSHYLIDDTSVGSPKKGSYVDWVKIEKTFELVFGKNFGEIVMNKALPVNNRTTFTKKPQTGFETQSHGGYVRTNSTTKESHFVAPKNFPGDPTPIQSRRDSKYREKYESLDLTEYPPDEINYADLRENMFGDKNTHWLIRWMEGDEISFAGNKNYAKFLEEEDLLEIQNNLLGWRSIIQKIKQRLENPKTEKDFTVALYELFMYQGCFTHHLKDLLVGDVVVGENSWTIDGIKFHMTKEVFDYADKLLYLKDPQAQVFSFKFKNTPFYSIEECPKKRLYRKSNRFKVLYGLLLQLHNHDMLKGIKGKESALSYLAAVTASVSKIYGVGIKEYWESIPFMPIKSYLMTGSTEGDEEPLLNDLETFCDETLMAMLKFPIRLDVVMTPFDTDFYETFFGKVNYDSVPPL